MICKTTIKVDEEEYVEVKHYERKGKILSNGFYHIKCFRDRLSGSRTQEALSQKAMQLMNKLGGYVE